MVPETYGHNPPLKPLVEDHFPYCSAKPKKIGYISRFQTKPCGDDNIIIPMLFLKIIECQMASTDEWVDTTHCKD
jgi:hypothetical protein